MKIWKIGICKNGNLEQWNFAKMEILKNANLEKCKFGKWKFGKMHI